MKEFSTILVTKHKTFYDVGEVHFLHGQTQTQQKCTQFEF